MDQNVINGFSFLLEIGTEDLPARFIPPALQQLKENTRKIFNEHHVSFSEMKTYGTPEKTCDHHRRNPLNAGRQDKGSVRTVQKGCL